MMRSNIGTAGVKQWAVADNVFSAAGEVTVSPTLPGGGTGRPVKIRASGNVSGWATLNIGAESQIVILINPNAPYTEEAIPASAFPGVVGSVPVELNASAAGTLVVSVGFA